MQDAVAQAVADSLHYWHEKRIELYAYCIMPNHVHTVFRIFEEQESECVAYLQQIMKSIKSFSAKEANKVLNTSGQFWQSFHDGEKVMTDWLGIQRSCEEY
ncbi:MAG: REP element-mobilizing transposase RayT [Flammeovirgaceae bacterium]|jgi:putative transposase